MLSWVSSSTIRAAETKQEQAESGGNGVDGRAVEWLRNRLSFRTTSFQPGGLGNLHLPQRFLRCVAKSRTGFQIWDVRDVTPIFLAIKHVDMIIAHGLVFHRQLEFFHVAEELSNLIWLRVTVVVLHVQGPRREWMLVNVMAATSSVLTIPERMHHFAEVLEADVPGT